MSQQVTITWKVTVIEEHVQTVELDKLPEIVREAILDGQIVSEEGCSAYDAADAMQAFVCEIEEEPHHESVTDRTVIDVELVKEKARG